MKRFFWLFIVICLVLIRPVLVAAQTNPQDQSNLMMKCLDATNIGENRNQHFVKLDGSGFLPNSPIEIWRETKEGFHCAIDVNGQSLCQSNALSAADNGREFQILSASIDQIVTDTNGEIHIAKVRSRTDKRLTHRFYGVQKTAATTEDADLPELTAEQYSLKLMTFLRHEEAVTPPSEATNCTTVFFDPYGRVFDAISLEPIPQVSVWLLDNNKNALPNRPGVENPNVTDFDGSFSFYVEDGTYYLDPKSSTHLFPVSANEISRLTGIQSVYYELYQGEPIIQQGAIQHRDIPMTPTDPNNPTNTLPVFMEKNIEEITENGVSSQKINGVVSHPKSIVNIFSGTRLVTTVNADNQGIFETKINNDLVDQTLPIDLIAEKVSLLSSNVLGLETDKQSLKTELFPKPGFLIGFVYDQNHQLATNTVVEIVIPEMQNRVYASVKTDENGFVLIPKQKLPPVDYVLKATINNQTITQSVQDFVNLNKTFLEKEKVNLLEPEEEAVARVVKNIQSKGAVYTQKYLLPTLSPTKTPKSTDNQQLPIYILLTLIVIGAIGILLIFLNRFNQNYKKPSPGSFDS